MRISQDSMAITAVLITWITFTVDSKWSEIEAELYPRRCGPDLFARVLKLGWFFMRGYAGMVYSRLLRLWFTINAVFTTAVHGPAIKNASRNFLQSSHLWKRMITWTKIIILPSRRLSRARGIPTIVSLGVVPLVGMYLNKDVELCTLIRASSSILVDLVNIFKKD
jgi:hypothetical protein